MDSKSAHRSVQPKKLSFQLLEEITDNFSEKLILGRGGFGVVYKGKYRSGEEIAVKMLNPMKELDDKRFWNEFQNLTRLKHPNIVELVGFCNETEKKTEEFNGRQVTAEEIHRALCFEYMHNGNLRKHLTDPHQGLDWHTRFNIIKGVCDGLRHLHKELEAPIYHLDLKPDNILLDKNMVPKIADFGLSRLFGNENIQKTLSSLGTRGYMPPEFIKDKIVSKAFDIFSLGVIIIKIMMGPTGYYQVGDMEPSEFIEFVQVNWKERLQKTASYSSLEDDCKQVKRCIEIARNCVEEEPTKRPSIGYIVSELNKFHAEGPIISNSDTHGRPSLGGSEPQTLLNRLPKQLPYEFIEQITSGFSNERNVGIGASAEVYKGVLEDGETIAVKRFRVNIIEDSKAFVKRTEDLFCLGEHKNIVKLIAYCSDVRKIVVEHNGRYLIAEVEDHIHCLEYLSEGNLRHHIYEKNYKLDWDIRFNIITGICQGLRFLHEQPEPIIHMGVTADNVLLDKNKEPKITGFSQSRFCSEEKTRTRTTGGTDEFSSGCMAPEYLYRGEISIKADIYSLGCLIIEIVTGDRIASYKDPSGRGYIKEVRERWTLEHIASQYPSLDEDRLEKVQECIEIGLNCTELDRHKRPSIGEILAILNRRSVGTMSNKDNLQLCPGFLIAHPLQLVFHLKQNRLASCSLHLTNNKDDHVAFRLQSNSPGRYLTKLPICGTVPPGCTYTLSVTMRKQKQQLESSGEDLLTLQSSIVGDEDLTNVDPDSIIVEYESFFERARETVRVHEVTLQAVWDQVQENTSEDEGSAAQEETSQAVWDWLQDKTSEKPIHSGPEVVATQSSRPVMSIDVDPMLHWIMTSHPEGDVCIWDYLTLGMVKSFKLTDEPVNSAKFVARKEWIVAGDDEGFIYVSGYDTTESCKPFKAHDRRVTCLAVHPTYPCILSSSEDRMIKLWDWSNNWQCKRPPFQGHSDTVTQVMFNPLDSYSFASASLDRTVKIWSRYSPKPKATVGDNPAGLLSVHYFTDGNNRHNLIFGSSNGSAQVWDPESEIRIQTLNGHANRLSAFYWHQECPMLITGSHDGTVRIWNSTTYRLETIINLDLGAVYAIGYVKGLRRIGVGCHRGIAMVKI